MAHLRKLSTNLPPTLYPISLRNDLTLEPNYIIMSSQPTEVKMRNIKFSELFMSVQGEAHRNGMPTVFFRFFGCNLQCDGFGQLEPTNPDSWVLPYKNPEIQKNFGDAKPVFTHGCDSSYSWHSKFKKFAETESANEISSRMISLLRSSGYNPENWVHSRVYTDMQLCFTGGEPMLWQDEMIEIVDSLREVGSDPSVFTIETNTTQGIKNEMRSFIETDRVHLACSPKLYNVSGEKRGIDIPTIQSYIDTGYTGSLKFVMNNREESWNELLPIVDALQIAPGWDLWIMPVGSTVESQNDEEIPRICERAIKEGFFVAGRTHIQLFGNKVGK